MAKAKVPEEHIREAAYHMWKKEGEPEGQDQDFWFRAEEELAKPKRRAPAKKAAAAPAANAAAPARKPAAKKPAARKTAAKPKTAE